MLREQIEADLLKLEQRTQSLIRQLADFVQIEVLLGECGTMFAATPKLPKSLKKDFAQSVHPVAMRRSLATSTAFPVRTLRRDHRSRASIASNRVWSAPLNRGRRD
jgi:hypothetical protein